MSGTGRATTHGDPPARRPHREEPTRRAALAGVTVAGLLLVLVAVAALWTRPASVPTYPAEAWTGQDVVEVASAVEVRAAGPFAACPRVWLPDGTRAGALLVDGWAASIPGLAYSEWRMPELRGVADGLERGDSRDSFAQPFDVRVLDLGDPDDVALARLWTDACGDADVAMVAPDAVLESLAVAP